MEDYEIAIGNSIEVLKNNVHYYLINGYKPIGGIFIYKGLYYQSMYKER